MFKKLCVMVLALVCGQVANAGTLIPFDFSGQINDVSFNDYEMVFRKSNTGTYQFTPGGQKFNIIVGDNIAIGDIFVQIYRANGLDVGGAGVANPYGAEELTAYSVQEIATRVLTPGGVAVGFKAASVDPFGVFSAAQLANGTALSLYYDAAKDFTHQSGGNPLGTVAPTAANLVADVASATNGGIFAQFGFGAASDAALGGVTNSNTNFTSLITAPYLSTSRSGTDMGTASAALNTKLSPLNYVFGGIIGTDGIEHSILGQASFAQNVNVPVGGGQLADYKGARNQGSSNWAYFSDDPFSFTVAVPEPSSVAVFGLGALLVGIRFRRRKA